MSSVRATPNDLVIEFSNNWEKRQRNLLKRKAKLDTYREILSKGETLTADQERAVEEYDFVRYSITIIKELVDGLNELQVKVEQAKLEEDQLIVKKHEEFSVKLLQNLGPIWELLLKINAPNVKAAVLKTSSQQQLNLLECISKSISMSDFDKIDSLTKEFDKVTTLDPLKEPAEILFCIAAGKNSSVPNPSSKANKGRVQTYAEFRENCLLLLSSDLVRNAMQSPFAEVIPTKKKQITKPAVSVSAEKPKQPTIESQPIKVEVKETIPVLPEAEIPSEAILKSVINPLKTNFNFLQASHVATLSCNAARDENAAVSQTLHTSHHPGTERFSQPQDHGEEAKLKENHRPYIQESIKKPNEKQSFTGNLVIHEHPPQHMPRSETLLDSNQTQQKHAQQDSFQAENQPPKSNEKSDTPRRAKPRRPKQAIVEKTSFQAVVVEEAAEQIKPSLKPKSWADRCGALPNNSVQPHPVSSHNSQSQPLANVQSHSMPMEHELVESQRRPMNQAETFSQDHPQNASHDHNGRRQFYGRERQEFDDRPRGGYRGGRGRPSGPAFRGGYGRGTGRGPAHPGSSRGEFHNSRSEPIQSAC